MKKPTFVFPKRVKTCHLSTPWITFRTAISDPIVWSKFSHFAAYCSAHHIGVGAASEDEVAEFLRAFAQSGRTYGPQRAEDMRREMVRLAGKLLGLALPHLNAPSARESPRKDQWERLPIAMKREIEALLDCYGDRKKPMADTESPAAKTEAETKAAERGREEKRRFLLRQLEFAENVIGRPIARLAELFTDEVLEPIEEANYGADGDWRANDNAKMTRSKLLEYGRVYAFDVLKDEVLGEGLAVYLKDALPHEKRVGRMAPTQRDGARLFTLSGTSTRLIANSDGAINAYFKQPRAKGLRTAAQAGVGVKLIIGTARPPFIVREAKFCGPEREIPDVWPRVRRQTLVVPDPTLPDLETDYKEPTRQTIDRFWQAERAFLGREPVLVFCTRAGEPMGGSQFTIHVTDLCKEAGVALSPKTLQVGAVRSLIDDGFSEEDIADMIGCSLLVNFRSRYRFLFQAKNVSAHANSVLNDEEDV